MIGKAITARKEYKQAEVNEQKDLEELYSSIQIAGDSKVTLTMEELDTYINEKMEEKLNEIQKHEPTSIKTDTWICNANMNKNAYAETTSMTGLTRRTDENNNIAEYLLYSEKDGYTVLKSRMVFYFYEVNDSKFRTFSRSFK